MKLKNCPFCGSNNIKPRYYMISIAMLCTNCDTEGPVHNTKGEAIKAWNTRADGWCPLEDAPDTEEDEYNDNECPKCGCKLSFGLSNDKWICTGCGLVSRDYYADTGEEE